VRFQRGQGVISMVVVLLIAGIGLLLVGLLTVGFGIQLELSLGNTLIFTGAIVACTGVLMLGLWMVVRELKNIARGLGEGIPAESPAGTWRQPRVDRMGSVVAPEDGELLFPRDQPGPERAANAAPSSPLPWHEQTASRDRPRHNAPAADEPADAAPAARQSDVFLLAERTRAGPGADGRFARRALGGRIRRAASGIVRRRLAKIGTCKGTRRAAIAAQRPGAIDIYPSRPCCQRNRAGSASRAE
jgi:hypothetical protein